MVTCTTCGNDSNDVAAFYWKKPNCDNQDCRGGYVKCTQCTYTPGGYMLKCCGFCGDDGKPAGKRRCTKCNGTGKGPVAVRHACEKTHQRQSSITTGSRPSSAGHGGRGRRV
ncbi:hypothetical protein C8A00DRAFT_38963 [Chaetomidium leptoderma]|uniref:Uncharacterized protein n=1 Tax=Chaetomidium leptoderma TaxID=669021 RepID=A0AAN6VCL4_9PEZI|nr:hypothetical protein C8A00DRAFT_38963 [Chaetomidium leptoderma]